MSRRPNRTFVFGIVATFCIYLYLFDAFSIRRSITEWWDPNSAFFWPEEPFDATACSFEPTNISHQTHLELYTSTSSCVKYAGESVTTKSCRDPKHTIFHTQWIFNTKYSEYDIAPKAIMAIKSFLTTQSRRSQLWVWSDRSDRVEYYLREIIAECPWVRVRHWDPLEAVVGTPLQGKVREANLRRNDVINWMGGDLLRMIVVQKYGGLYFDLDTLFLRDVSPLLNEDFIYREPCSENKAPESAPFTNGAMMHARQPNSSMTFNFCQVFIDDMQEEAVEDSLWDNNKWGNLLYKTSMYKYGITFTIFPSCFFDAGWRCKTEQVEPSFIGFDEMFVAVPGFRLDRFFPGAFVFHWHNKWHVPTIPQSPYDQISTVINDNYAKLLARRRRKP